MWQMDNDRYALWRLEHELGVRRQVDQLLNRVTVSDRAIPLFRLNLLPVAGVARRLFSLLYSRTALGPIVPRPSE